MRQLLSYLFITGALFIATAPFIIATGARACATQAVIQQASEKRFGFLKSITKIKDRWQIKINYASFFEGDAAERAAKEDGESSPAELSGIYIRDHNPRLHIVALASRTEIFLLHNLEPHRLTIEQFARLMHGDSKGLPDFWGFPNYIKAEEGLLCQVTLVRGEVVKIEQVYLP